MKNLDGRPLIHGLIRNQLNGRSRDAQSSCTAQALGSVIDILRLIDGSVTGTDLGRLRVSADMLYEQGRSLEAQELGRSRPAEGLSSLRSVIKAFYHNGVCSERQWSDSHGGDRKGRMRDDVAIAKAARDIPLGAYYRLRPILNDYHSALNEVGAVFAAAEVHAGWSRKAVARTGRIDLSLADSGPTGNHAFVILGYDEQGFLILNSWGADWGGYRSTVASIDDARMDGRETRWPGIAHWSYQDWAARIIDGWVLRLGVPTLNAFECSLGEHGLSAFAGDAIRSGSTPRRRLIGHYVHLDDGAFVETGAYPSDRRSIRTTVDLLNARITGRNRDGSAHAELPRAYSSVLLWIAGGNERTKDVVTDAALTKDYWKQQGIYPITVFWCSDFIGTAMVVLERIFQAAVERIGRPGQELNRQIEIEARGIGRAFWRDIKSSARRTATPDGKAGRAGAMWEAFEELLQLDPRVELHVVAEGAGAILLSELIKTIVFEGKAPGGAERLARIKSLTLLAPACTAADFDEALLEWHRRTGERILLLVQSARTERRMTTGLYRASVLELIQRSFEEENPGGDGDLPSKAVRILGTSDAAESLRPLRKAVRIEQIEAPEGEGSIPTLRSVTFSTAVRDRIAAHMAPSGKAQTATHNIRRPVIPRNKARNGRRR